MLTIEGKRQFVEDAKADSARFLDTKTTPAFNRLNFQPITSRAEGRALTRRARGWDDDEDGDDASLKKVV